MVRLIARRVHRMITGVEYADLIGDGSIGAIQAVDAYDPSRGTTLETYARRLILGKILHGIRRMDPVSERARRELREAEDQCYAMAISRGSIPTLSEMQCLRPRLAGALRRIRQAPPLSLDRPLPDGTEPPSDRDADPVRIVVKESIYSWLGTSLATLPERQRHIVMLHYFADVPFYEIGSRLTISAQRASQLHLKALRRLRKMSHVTPY
jgi:RNA polymerase sigma factor for flagellar operon FliA